MMCSDQELERRESIKLKDAERKRYLGSTLSADIQEKERSE